MQVYKNFTIDHWLPILIISVLCMICISYFGGKRYSLENRYRFAFYFSLIPFFSVVVRMVILAFEGKFTIEEELPLHLCRLIAMFLPCFIYYKNKKWLVMLYFLIIVGTLQALITADLEFTFPHYSYIIYWIFHVTLVWVGFYLVKYLDITPTLGDIKKVFVVGNIYMISTLILNFAIGSNYFYTRMKPPGGSLLDLFGPWPYYIFVVEVLALLLFYLAYLPFRKSST